uniref:CC chemokine SCYA116 n=1 Tax=Epinephelus coioides TaxID=94232 RepID=A0A8E4BPB3_EPICO|nr:CC chemokine SCYA116 [Epinephelus coioides]
MESCVSMLKSALVVIVLVAAVQSGVSAEKLVSCCKKVNNQEITEPILGYLVQQPNPPCVRAVIFQTKSGFYCSQLTAPWVRREVIAFEQAKARAAALAVVPPSPVSLLSIITSTASPASSSSLPSSPSTSEMPAGETFSERDSA